MGRTVPLVLVADDDDSILNLISICLERDGYEILPARNGREALAAWKRRRTEIELVITDIEMPEMSGVELADRLHRSHAGIPILFISGSAEASTLSGMKGVEGSIHFLSKPFDLRVLSQMVEGLMHPTSHPAQAIS
jgi:CheY-like chemotaxis protein